MYELSCRMQPSAVDSSLRLEALVEDAFKNLNEGGAEASTAGGSRGQNGAVIVLDDRWRHHALHPLARLERIHEQVRLPEHAEAEIVACEWFEPERLVLLQVTARDEPFPLHHEVEKRFGE